VVLATAARQRLPPRPRLYARAHLANSASLLLPVPILTNLLAFAAGGLSVTGFAALMALPWLGVVGTEYVIFRWFFAEDLWVNEPTEPPAAPVGLSRPTGQPAAPAFALAVIGRDSARLRVGRRRRRTSGLGRRGRRPGGVRPPPGDVRWRGGAPARGREPAVVCVRIRPRHRGARGPFQRRRCPGGPAGTGAARRARAVDGGVRRRGAGEPGQQPARDVDAGTASRALPRS
jgi:hypothetical protein